MNPTTHRPLAHRRGPALVQGLFALLIVTAICLVAMPDNPGEGSEAARQSNLPGVTASKTPETTPAQLRPVPAQPPRAAMPPRPHGTLPVQGKKPVQAPIIDMTAVPGREACTRAEKDLFARHPKLVGKLEQRLIATVDQIQNLGEEQARGALKKQGVIFADDGPDLAVIIVPEDSATTTELRTVLERQGIKIIREDGNTLKAAVPLGKLAALAGLQGVQRVRTLAPPRETNTVMTQGRTATQASVWQTGGATGAGSKIAIVDGGFLGYASLITQDELPAALTTVNYSATAMDAGSSHGTACAEIIYDLAPGAQMVLIKVDDPTDLVTAASYCAANGVKVVSCSLAYDGMNFHDGLAHQNWFTGVANHPVTAVESAAANNILWVNAAGNERRQQSVIDWVDANGDGSLDWTPASSNLNILWYYNTTTQSMTTSIPSGVVLDVIMTWNQWGTTDQDFDLRLFKNTGSGWTPVTSGFAPGWHGQDSQTGSATSYPHEEIIFTTTDASAQYAVAVTKFSATTTPKFILRYYGADEPNYFGFNNTSAVPAGSIGVPADSASAFTVGALDVATYTTGTIEAYSSLGPNNRAFTGGTAVMKPDICGPVWVDTASRGTEAFGGTSAATPHIAGLAALVRGSYPTMTVAATRSYLEAKSVDRGVAGKDNIYGSGAARVTSEAPPLVTAIDRAAASPAPPGTVQFNVTFNKSVTGGTASNFQLATTGVSGASITGVTGSGTTRTVTVNTGTGTGTIGLDMVNSTGVMDSAGNEVASLPFTGQVYTIALPDITLAVSPSSMAEDAAGTMVYTFTRSGSTAGALTVNFSVGGTATLTTDYTQTGAATFTSTTGTVTFAASSSTATVAIDPVTDLIVESSETVVLTLATGTGYNVGTPSGATSTIANDDTDAGVAAFPTFMNEDTSGTMDFTFTRTGVTTSAITMSFSVAGTATFGTDYSVSGAATFTSTSGTVSFAAGATSAVVSIDPTSDITLEGDETVILTITPGSGYNVGSPSSASVTIINDEASISVSVSPASMNEDAAGTMAYTFTRAGYAGTPLTVGFNVGGTATSGTDYSQTGAATFGATSGTVQFGLGTTSVTVNIDPTADATPESDETVILSVASSINYVTGSPSFATGTILNDDAASVTVAISPSNMAEDAAGTMAYTFTRTGTTTNALTINFSVEGTATFSTDYAQSGAATFGASSGTVTFASGSSTVVIHIDPTVDTTVESDETVILTVTGGAGYTVGSPSAATATITNDDTSISVAVSPTSMAEDAAGTMAFTFTRSGVTTGALTANFSVGGTATFGTDYAQTGAATFSSSNGTVTFAAGSASAVVNLDPITDALFETNESAIITVAAGSGYSVGLPSSATATINNDDGSPTIQWSAATSSASESTASVTVTATLSTVSGQDAVVHVTRSGSAIDLTDYEVAGQPLEVLITIPAGQTSSTLTLNILNDALDEADENVVLTMDSFPIQNATVGSPGVHTLTILDDDNPEIAVEQPAGTNQTDGTASIGFGSSPIGTPVVLTFTIRNTGTAALTSLAVTKDGTNSADYAVSSLGATSVPAGGSTTFNVTFTPSASGTRTAAIHIASNDADENPFDIQLTGSGSSANPTSFADDFDPGIDAPLWSAFGGTATADTAAQLAGPGSTGNSLRFDGTGSRFALTRVLNMQAGGSIGFLFTQASGTGSTWETADAGEEVVLEYTIDSGTTFVQFAGPYSHRQWQHLVVPIPVAAQTDAVQFRFRQLANSGPNFDHWALDDMQIGTSVATYAEIGIEQPSGTRLTDGSSTATFTNAVVGQSSMLTFTIRNQGSASLTGIAATIDGANAGDFTVSTPPPTSVTAAGMSTFIVTFAPTSAGTRTAALHIASNDANENPYDITLSATGIAATPDIAVEYPSAAGLTDNSSIVGFPVAAVGASVTRTFTIRNTGTASLTGLSVSKDGPGSAAFTISGPAVTALAASTSTTFTVTFTAADASTSNAAIHIASNDADENPFDISLTGQAATTHEFASTGPITIPHSGTAMPYPSVIPVAGLAGTVAAVRVKLNGFSHTYPDDVDIFIVSPSGAVSVLMSDAGGSSGVTSQNYTFDDHANTAVPDVAALFTGTYRPANYDTSESLPPGSIGVIGSALLPLAQGGMNGDWKLFVSDDLGGLEGSITSWSIVIETSLPEITVEEPAGTGLTDGSATLAFTGMGIGLTPPPALARTITIRNSGPGTLTGLSVSKDGADSTSFAVGTPAATTLQPGASATFSLSFVPVGGSSGPRTAAIHIASNDEDENPFDISLSGLALSPTTDGDNDGMNDWGEYQLAAMGFDWQVDNSALVDSYFAAANSNGLYTASQVQAMNVGTPLIQRNPATGIFTLSIGINKSTDLTTWTPFPFLSPQTTIDGQGRVQFQFTVPDNAAFFQLQSQ